MRRYQTVPAGIHYSTLLPSMDFETYSEAGYAFRDGTFKSVKKGATSGLDAVGAMNYSLHPTTEVLCLSYDLLDGKGKQLWKPGMPPPTDLFRHILSGGLIESWNCSFENYIWNNVCHARMGWPYLPHTLQRDAMAKARAFSLPGKLGKAGEVLGTDQQKDKEGTRLLNKFSKPRNPTKGNPSLRIRPEDDPEDAAKLYAYCVQDITTEESISALLPDLLPDEEEFRLNTMKCNATGIGIRMDEIDACISILEQAYPKYNSELAQLTGGIVTESSKVAQLLDWLHTQGFYPSTLDDEVVTDLLRQDDLPPHVRRVLEIRSMTGSAGVKKVYAMKYLATPDERLTDLFIYHGARTGRDTGAKVQPQNLPKAGPKVLWCGGCEKPFGVHHTISCPHCGGSVALLSYSKDGWNWEAVDHAIDAIKTRSLEYVEWIFGDAILTVLGCIRGLLVARPGYDLICSDYSAIEAVVLAALAGEQWRLDTFARKEDIYLRSASSITGTPYEDYLSYAKENGSKHPDRQKIGKVAELASGYAGWIGAWKAFGADKHHSDDAIKKHILAWRTASPAIVEFWGGQRRSWNGPWEPFGVEGAVVQAILYPGQCFTFRGLSFGVKEDVLYIRLPSGRSLVYHSPKLSHSTRREGVYTITYRGWNTNPKMGAMNKWIEIETFGGRLTENIVQAVSRDIMAYAVNNLERDGYPCVIRVHDEIAGEVPEGWGSIEEFERIMGTLPSWAEGWPVRASGGWRGKRYRKD